MSELLSRLTPEQREIVQQADGYSLIIASAGTGKTTTMVGRIAHLLENKGVAPENILLLTFTNKAAEEMITRLSVHHQVDKIWSGTFHSISNRLLRQMPADILEPYQANFSIKTTTNLKTLFRQLFQAQELDKKKIDPGQLLETYWLGINRGYGKDEILPFLKQRFGLAPVSWEKVQTLLQEYEQLKQGYNTMDFNDLLYVTREKLVNHQELLQQIATRFQYILVDEYQDTNYPQERLIEALSSVHGNLFAVGDYDQTIFSFQGSSVDIIGEFQQKYPRAQVFNLPTNFRSTHEILNLAQQVIAKNKRLYPKKLIAHRTSHHLSEARPRYCQHFSDQSQVRMVMENILRNSVQAQGHHPHHVPLKENAIIYRSNKTGNAFELACKEYDIPYVRKGGMSFFDRYEISEALNVIEAVHNPRDAMVWSRLFSHISGLGAVGTRKLIAALQQQNKRILSAYLSWGRGEDGLVLGQRLPTKSVLPWQHLHTMISNLADIKQPARFFQQLVAMPFFRQQILESYVMKKKKKGVGEESLRDEIEERLNKIDMLREQAERYKTSEAFLSSIALTSQRNSSGDGIALMTIHSAKGLEWKKVFLVDVYDGAFPNTRLMGAQALSEEEMVQAVEEERRLFYVAITRAKDYLFINYPTKQVQSDGKQMPYPQSRFMDELLHDRPESVMMQKLM